jgi:hypothetical protein
MNVSILLQFLISKKWFEHRLKSPETLWTNSTTEKCQTKYNCLLLNPYWGYSKLFLNIKTKDIVRARSVLLPLALALTTPGSNTKPLAGATSDDTAIITAVTLIDLLNARDSQSAALEPIYSMSSQIRLNSYERWSATGSVCWCISTFTIRARVYNVCGTLRLFSEAAVPKLREHETLRASVKSKNVGRTLRLELPIVALPSNRGCGGFGKNAETDEASGIR